MSNEKKTNIPLLISIICFAAGMIIGAWGWDKNESTIAARTVGSVPMIVVGCAMIVGGLIGMFTMGGKTNR
jgi:TRAP-type C4-dicarboxylate transport system permease small subunit